MKNYRYKTAAFFAITLLTISTTLFAAEVTKEYHKEYTTKPTTTLDINSRYGNVTIESWDKNQIVIDVKVTVNALNRERAERDISNIDVFFSENGDLIKALTKFDSKYFSKGINIESVTISVDYNIKMPVNTTLNLENRYGNTFINELSGLVNISIRYGNLTVGKLMRGNEKSLTTIELGYGNVAINEVGWLVLKTQYAGNVEIPKCTAALIENRYSNLNFGEVGSIVGESRYGSMNIDNIRNLDLDNRYTTVKIGMLTNSLKLDNGYGPVTIDRIPSGFESIEVETKYTNVNLGIADDASYELNGEARYGVIKYDNDKFNLTRRIQENNSLKIVGVMKKEVASKSKVMIETVYGSVQLGR